MPVFFNPILPIVLIQLNKSNVTLGFWFFLYKFNKTNKLKVVKEIGLKFLTVFKRVENLRQTRLFAAQSLVYFIDLLIKAPFLIIFFSFPYALYFLLKKVA